jgi:hypothetical protein
MLAMQNYSAASLDRSRRNGVASPVSLLWRSRLMPALKAHLDSEASSPSDQLLLAVGGASAAITETRYGISNATENQELDAHLHGLSTMIILRGGWLIMASQGSTLSWFLYW